MFSRTLHEYGVEYTNVPLYIKFNAILYPVFTNIGNIFHLDAPRTCINLYKFTLDSTPPLYLKINTKTIYIFVKIKHDAYFGFFVEINDIMKIV